MAEQVDPFESYLKNRFGDDFDKPHKWGNKPASGNLATDVPKAAARGIARLPDVMLSGAQTAASGYAKAIDAAQGNTDSGHISDLEGYAQKGIGALRDATTRKFADYVDESLPYSKGTQRAQKELEAGQQQISDDKSLGALEKVGLSVGNALSNPRGALPSVAESIPQFLVGAQALKAAKVASGLSEANQARTITGLGNFALEGEGAARGANQTILSLPPEELRKNKNFLDLENRFGFDAAKKIAAEAAGTAAYAPAAALGAGASAVTGGGLEGALIGRSLGVNKAASSALKATGLGALGETTEEALQGGSGQIAQNLAEQPYTGVDTFSQVPEQIGQGAAIGALSGGAGGLVGHGYDKGRERFVDRPRELKRQAEIDELNKKAKEDADKIRDGEQPTGEVDNIQPVEPPPLDEKTPLSNAFYSGAKKAAGAKTNINASRTATDPEIKEGPLAGAPEPESTGSAKTVMPGSSIDIGATPEDLNASDYTSAFDNKEKDEITPLQSAEEESQIEAETQGRGDDAGQPEPEQANRPAPENGAVNEPAENIQPASEPVGRNDRPESIAPTEPVSRDDNSLPVEQQEQVQSEYGSDNSAPKPVTKRAANFLNSLRDDSIPKSLSSNLKQIANENEIAITKTTTPNDVINQLKERAGYHGQLTGETLLKSRTESLRKLKNNPEDTRTITNGNGEQISFDEFARNQIVHGAQTFDDAKANFDWLHNEQNKQQESNEESSQGTGETQPEAQGTSEDTAGAVSTETQEQSASDKTGFEPTHTLNDGYDTPAIKIGENLYQDAEGYEIEDDSARPIVNKAEIDKAAHQAATSPLNNLPEPTEAQKESGDYKKGHINLHGLDIAIENPKGSIRSGTDQDGNKWENEIKHHYGYIKRTNGADGDEVDVFVGEHPESTKAFVVNQIDPKTGKFDEHKIMLGFNSKGSAKAGYLRNYAKGWKGAESITELSIDELKQQVEEGKLSKPKPVVPDDKFTDKPISVYDKAAGLSQGDADFINQFHIDKEFSIDELEQIGFFESGSAYLDGLLSIIAPIAKLFGVTVEFTTAIDDSENELANGAPSPIGYINFTDTISINVKQAYEVLYSEKGREQGKKYGFAENKNDHKSFKEFIIRALAHELLHAVTVDAFLDIKSEKYKKFGVTKLNFTQVMALKSIEKIFNFLQETYQGADVIGGKEYGLTDLFEFVAELSNEAFVSKLKGIELPVELRYTSKKKSIFDSIVGFVRQLLTGTKQADNNASDSVFNALSDLYTSSNGWEDSQSKEQESQAKPEYNETEEFKGLVGLFKEFGKIGRIKPNNKALKNNPQADKIANIQNHWTDVVSDYVYGSDDGQGNPFNGKKDNKVEREC